MQHNQIATDMRPWALNWERLALAGYGRVATTLSKEMRAYFEANRPLTFREKLFGRVAYVESCVDDDLMLGLLMVAHGVRP